MLVTSAVSPSGVDTIQVTSHMEERALKLLGQGYANGIVASALGVTDGRISQLLADPEFAARVQALRFEALQTSTKLDDTYNEIEDLLLVKLKKAVPMIMRPREILSAIHVINGAKRRGVASPESVAPTARIVNLVLPVTIQQKFISNINSQIVEVQDGEGNSQTLVTAGSAQLPDFAKLAGIGASRASSLTSGRPEESCGDKVEVEAGTSLTRSRLKEIPLAELL